MHAIKAALRAIRLQFRALLFVGLPFGGLLFGGLLLGVLLLDLTAAGAVQKEKKRKLLEGILWSPGQNKGATQRDREREGDNSRR